MVWDTKQRIKSSLKRILVVLIPQIGTILAEMEIIWPEYKWALAILGLVITGCLKGFQKDKYAKPKKS